MPILKARIYNNDKMITFNSIFLTETKISYSGFDKSFYEEKISSYASNSSKNRIKHYYENNNRQDKSIIICNQGKTIILGGFYDGSIKILNFAKNIFTKKFPFKTEEPVFALAIDEEEKYLFAGNSIGNIIIYKIDFDAYEWEILLNNTDQLSEISHIHVNNELNIWLSATLNGYINLYTIPSFKLIRSLKTKAKT
jgi:WD40 repeat protein